jgi:acetyl-CoA carboxylase carboxyltransferase component
MGNQAPAFTVASFATITHRFPEILEITTTTPAEGQPPYCSYIFSARQRINQLVDNPDEVFEIGVLAAENMYEQYGGCPSAGVVVVISKISGKRCVIVANDATVKAGAWFPMTAKKNLRAQEIAIENKIPIIYLVDSAGIFLPLQD